MNYETLSFSRGQELLQLERQLVNWRIMAITFGVLLVTQSVFFGVYLLSLPGQP